MKQTHRVVVLIGVWLVRDRHFIFSETLQAAEQELKSALSRGQPPHFFSPVHLQVYYQGRVDQV